MSCTGCRPPSARGRTPPSRPAWTGRTSWAFRSCASSASPPPGPRRTCATTHSCSRGCARPGHHSRTGASSSPCCMRSRTRQPCASQRTRRSLSATAGGCPTRGGGATGSRANHPAQSCRSTGTLSSLSPRLPRRPSGRPRRCGRRSCGCGTATWPSPRAVGPADARLAGNQRSRARSATWEPPSWIRWTWTRAWRPFPAHGGNIAGPRASCPVRGGEASLVRRREE